MLNLYEVINDNTNIKVAKFILYIYVITITCRIF